LKHQSIVMRDLTKHHFYQYLSIGFVTSSALIELYTLQLANRDDTSARDKEPIIANWIQISLQMIFTLDLYCKVVAAYPGITVYFYNRWNQFDAALVVATWIPVATIGMKGSLAQYIGRVNPTCLSLSRLLLLLFVLFRLDLLLSASLWLLSSSLFFFHYLSSLYLFLSLLPLSLSLFMSLSRLFSLHLSVYLVSLVYLSLRLFDFSHPQLRPVSYLADPSVAQDALLDPRAQYHPPLRCFFSASLGLCHRLDVRLLLAFCSRWRLSLLQK
jgi:hypothetical protein